MTDETMTDEAMTHLTSNFDLSRPILFENDHLFFQKIVEHKDRDRVPAIGPYSPSGLKEKIDHLQVIDEKIHREELGTNHFSLRLDGYLQDSTLQFTTSWKEPVGGGWFEDQCMSTFWHYEEDEGEIWSLGSIDHAFDLDCPFRYRVAFNGIHHDFMGVKPDGESLDNDLRINVGVNPDGLFWGMMPFRAFHVDPSVHLSFDGEHTIEHGTSNSVANLLVDEAQIGDLDEIQKSILCSTE